jgi:tripartite-type tricarboxylate transporter receptor subunit TctC
MNRRTFLPRALGIASLLAMGAALPLAACAQNYPAKPIRIVVGFPPGGPADLVARVVGEKLAQSLGQPVLVENKPGASQNIAAALVARAPSDGYTLLMGSTAVVVNHHLYKDMKFDVFRDFAPIGTAARTPLMVVVNNKLPVKNMQELVALTRSKPGSINYGSGVLGSTTHLAVEAFKAQAGIAITNIPYQGGGPMLTDLMGGQVDLAFDTMVASSPLVRSGKLRAIAVTSATRSSIAPDLPTVAESGYPGFEAIGWFGLLAPRGTPEPILQKVHTALQQALADADVARRLEGAGGEVMSGSRAEFQKLMRSESDKWGAVIQRLGIKLD